MDMDKTICCEKRTGTERMEDINLERIGQKGAITGQFHHICKDDHSFSNIS